MLNDKISDRERLLKLIDGGPEVMKEIEKKETETLDRARVAAVITFLKAKATSKNFLLPGGIIAALVLFAAVYFIFMKHSVPSPPAQVVTHATDKNLPASAAVRLKLVGVDWSDTPVALIEDTRTGRTYFAKKNDMVNDAKVQQIFKDKVIVQVHHQTVELKS